MLCFANFQRIIYQSVIVFFYAITHDILTPILGIRSLVELLLRKYLDSPNEHHAEVFLAQGIVEAILGTMLTVYLAVIVFQML